MSDDENLGTVASLGVGATHMSGYNGHDAPKPGLLERATKKLTRAAKHVFSQQEIIDATSQKQRGSMVDRLLTPSKDDINRDMAEMYLDCLG